MSNTARAEPDKRWLMLGLPEVGVQDFYQRLVDHNLISNSPLIRPHCPLCLQRLIACSSCSTVTCGATSLSNSQCVGAGLIRMFRSCSNDNMMFCHDCVMYDHSGLLSQCTLCEARYCPGFMTKFTQAKWKECSERAWQSREHDNPDVCLDCTKTIRSHVTCPCGLAWVCGLCAQKEIQKSGRRCPRCQTFYCFDGCRYVNACTECQKTTLCRDCAEEDTSDEEGPSPTNKGAVLVTKCELLFCEDCGRTHCQGCIDDNASECMECGVSLCPACTDYECIECRVFGSSRTDSSDSSE